MRKQIISLLGTSAALLAASQASAGALGAPNEIFIGGASAVQRTFHLDLVLRFCQDDGNTNEGDGIITPAVYTESIGTVPGNGDGSAALPALALGDQIVVHCNFKTTFGAGNALNGAEVAVYKFNGGSATGVAPVADPAGADASAKQYLDASPASCTQEIPSSNPQPGDTFTSVDGATRFALYECDDLGTVAQDPDGGISDVEPKLFVGQLASGFGGPVPGVADRPQQDFVDQGNLIVKAGAGITFGTAVSLPMYDELLDDQQAAGLLPDCPASPSRAQRDSIACMPSLPTAMIQSAFTGEIARWSVRDPYGLPLDTSGVADGDRVNVCRRTAGSGTNAQFAAHYLRTNCINNSTAMVTVDNDPLAFLQVPVVYENSGSSDMDDCLDALGDGEGFNGDFTDGLTAFPDDPTSGDGDSSVVPAGRDAFGIGYNSLERNTSLGRNYRFVKVDFAAPTLEDTFNGIYDDIYYLSYQNRVSSGTTPDPRTGAIRTVAADAGEIAVMEAFFEIWNSPTPAAVQAVNDGLIVNPDGVDNNGDEWQGGFLAPTSAAPQAFSAGPVGTDPRTPWGRATIGGTADSCQELSISNNTQ
jgi:hypothetical protein